MTKFLAWLADPKARLWLYGIAAVAIPLLSFYGILSEESVPLWTGLAVALLGLAAPTVAIKNWNNVPSTPAPAVVQPAPVDEPESSEG